MERLTIRKPDGAITLAKEAEIMCFGNASTTLEEVIRRLAAYEDLGITPEQVRELDRICTEKMQEVEKYHKLEDEGKMVCVCHCKECVHWSDKAAGATEHAKLCTVGGYMVGENGYCVYGERRG